MVARCIFLCLGRPSDKHLPPGSSKKLRSCQGRGERLKLLDYSNRVLCLTECDHRYQLRKRLGVVHIPQLPGNVVVNLNRR